jgi:heme exporter protein D
MGAVRVGGAVTVLALAGFVIVSIRREQRVAMSERQPAARARSSQLPAR